jgi:NADPH:quinone reductase-like Zn-dependent oxidoreductase
MTALTRRTLLAGAAATTALAATSSRAQSDAVQIPAELSGKSILITGCSSGFGRLGAEHYARLGARVFATCRVPKQRN